MSGAEIPAIIGAVAAVGGTAYQISEQEAAKERQAQAASQEMARQARYQQQIDEEMANAINALQQNKDTTQSLDDYATNQQNEFKSIVDNINVTNPNVIMGRDTGGKVSDAYISRIAKNKSNEIAKAAELARLLGRVRGPSQSGIDRSLSYADAGMNMGVVNRNAVRSSGLLNNELALAGRTNDIPGAVLTGVGNAGLSGTFDSYFKPNTTAATKSTALK